MHSEPHGVKGGMKPGYCPCLLHSPVDSLHQSIILLGRVSQSLHYCFHHYINIFIITIIIIIILSFLGFGFPIIKGRSVFLQYKDMIKVYYRI